MKKRFEMKKMVKVIFYLGLALSLQLLSNFLFGENIYVLVGMLSPMALSTPVKNVFGKYKKAYVFYMNIVVRMSFMAIAVSYIATYKEDILSDYTLWFVGLLVAFSISIGTSLTYSFSGVIAINAIAVYFMESAYPQFAVGFLAFFVFELIRGETFTFFAFSKSEVKLNFPSLDARKKTAFITMSIMAILILILNIPGAELYAFPL